MIRNMWWPGVMLVWFGGGWILQTAWGCLLQAEGRLYQPASQVQHSDSLGVACISVYAMLFTLGIMLWTLRQTWRNEMWW